MGVKLMYVYVLCNISEQLCTKNCLNAGSHDPIRKSVARFSD